MIMNNNLPWQDSLRSGATGEGREEEKGGREERNGETLLSSPLPLRRYAGYNKMIKCALQDKKNLISIKA